MQHFVRTLNKFYLDHAPFWQNETDWEGFQWIQADDRDNSIIAFRRIDRQGREILVICNFCPVLREHYRLGLPKPYYYEPVLCTDDKEFGGYGFQPETVKGEKTPWRNYPCSAEFRVPPMSTTYYIPRRTLKKKEKQE